MKEKIGVQKAPKFVLWISVFCVIFVGIAITSDILGYRLPAFGTSNTYMSINSQPAPPSYIFEADSKFTTVIIPNKVDIDVQNKSKQNTSTIKIDIKYRSRQSNRTIENDIKNKSRQMKTRVAFLKVHKAGSTTMQNLFFRFGLRHKLNIRLPTSGNHIKSLSGSVNLPPGQKFDIFACHTIYSKQWFDSLLPANSVRIGIVREPISRMISGAYYYRYVWGVGYLKRVPKANYIHNIVNFPEKYDRSFFSHTRNSMGSDFGFKANIKPGDKSIKTTLENLNNEFLLVMVVEKFDASLVLLKRYLNWSFADISYLKTNTFKHIPVVLNKTEKAKFRKTSFLDFELYDYFSNVFETKLKNAGDDFEEELQLFQSILDQVSAFCSKIDNADGNEKLVIQKSKWDEEFQVLASDCVWMKTPELKFIDKLRSRRLYVHGGVK